MTVTLANPKPTLPPVLRRHDSTAQAKHLAVTVLRAAEYLIPEAKAPSLRSLRGLSRSAYCIFGPTASALTMVNFVASTILRTRRTSG